MFQDRHVLDIGPSPHGEKCAQFGTPDFSERNKIECEAFRNQLRRQFPEQCELISLSIVRNPYEDDAYHEVCAVFWGDDDEAKEAACFLQDNAPEFWDEEAKNELSKFWQKHLQTAIVNIPTLTAKRAR